MMRTPEMIKRGLECCSSNANCADGCPYHVVVEGFFGYNEMGCDDGLLPDALALIRKMEAIADEQEQIILDKEAEIERLEELIAEQDVIITRLPYLLLAHGVKVQPQKPLELPHEEERKNEQT